MNESNEPKHDLDSNLLITDGLSGDQNTVLDHAAVIVKIPAKKRSRHGMRALKVKVNTCGWSAIDGRTVGGKNLMVWRSELLSDLGGEANLSKQKVSLVDLVVRTRLFIDHIDAWLLAQPKLTLSRRRSLIPAVKERQQLVDSMARLLSQLGLDRVEKRVPTLAEYLASKEGDGQ